MNHKPDIWNFSLVDQYDVFIFDCDGVFWRGDYSINGTSEMLDRLRQKFTLSFNSIIFDGVKSRQGYCSYLGSKGIQANTNEIICSSHVTASYLIDHQIIKHQDDRVVVLGGQGLIDELKIAQIQCILVDQAIKNEHLSNSDYDNILNSYENYFIRAVIIGLDHKFTFSKGAFLQQFLHQPQTLLISTNQDATFPINKTIIPGNGSIVSFIETAAQRKAINIGKPTTQMFEMIQRSHHFDPRRCLMVGDRLDTDILFGLNCGIDTLLVMTGVTTKEMLSKSSIIPHYIIDSAKSII